jgi:hypothetical protein
MCVAVEIAYGVLEEGREQTAWDSFRHLRGVAVGRKSIRKVDPLFCTCRYTIVLLCWKSGI